MPPPDAPNPAPAAVPIDETDPLPCPSCGYDLRGTEGTRCSECGSTFDRAALAVSALPWVHRRGLSRVPAYLATVWLITVDARRLRHEAAKPLHLPEARLFRRVTAALLAISLVGLLVAVIDSQHGLAFLAIEPLLDWSGRPGSNWMYDLAIPWSAGAILWPVLPLGLCLLAWRFNAAPARFFHLPDSPPVRQERAQALACYASAPVAWLPLLAGLWFAGAMALDIRAGNLPLLLIGIIGVIAVLAAFVRVLQWIKRVRHCGFERILLLMFGLPALWLLDVIIALGVFPWCAGFLWIVVDSLR